MSKEMDKGILTNADMKQRKNKVLYWCLFLIALLFCFISFFPVVWILLSGFKDVKELYAVPASLFPEKIELSKIAKVWSEMKFYKYYASTFIMAIGAAVVTCGVCGLAGYAMSRLKPKGTKVLLVILLWIMMLPGTMRTVPIYMIIKDFPIGHFSMLDSYVPIWLMSAANAFTIILFKNFFDGIPLSLVEAAKIDGAGSLKIFVRIIIPLSMPVFMTVGLLTFNGQFGQFLWPYLLISKKEMTVLGVQLFKMKNGNYTMDYQMIALLFSILPQIILFALFQKQIMGGVSVGAVKG